MTKKKELIVNELREKKKEVASCDIVSIDFFLAHRLSVTSSPISFVQFDIALLSFEHALILIRLDR